jgi:HlyD family secretion protein
MAQSRMDSIQVEAPFDGVVTVLSVQPGDVVKAGAQAVQLDDLSHLFLDVQISEVDIPLVEIGQPAELVFDAYYEDTFSGEVVEISPVGSSIQGVVEYAVRIQLEDGDGKIKPGMTASVNIIVEEKDDVLVVPNSAIVTLDGQEQVFVNRNGNFVAVPVTLGSYSDYYSEIIEADIEEGELIVIDPPSELTGGDLPFGDTSGSPFSRMGN